MFFGKWIAGALGATALGAALFVGVQDRPATTATAPAAAATAAKPALWSVSDADTTIYLFGTVHVLKPGLTWFDGAVRDAFDKSDTLVLELVLPEDPAAIQPALMKHGIAMTGPTLREKLTPEQRTRYEAAVKAVGQQPEAFDRFRPWFAANNIGLLAVAKEGYDPNSGAEKVLTDAAKAAGKRIAAFETLDIQFGFFSGLPERTEIGFLTMTVDEFDEAGSSINRMVDRWAAGDPDGLAAILNESLVKLPEMDRVLLSERNANWTTWIAERMQQPGTVFVAVGAGHLAGPNSVNAMLAKRGVTVNRIQ